MDPNEARAIAHFVVESNAIEGIFESAGHPLVDDHIAACQYVINSVRSRDGVPSPMAIHRILMASQPEAEPGRLREKWVKVGGDIKMSPFLAKHRYYELLARVNAALGKERPAYASEEDIWRIHHEFEWIHPFLDGNGRTGRLWMNGIRLAYGYTWLVVKAEDKQEYYDSIRHWEESMA